jgi:unsaturated rhamnogalacturonyl hydrolase
VNTTAPYLPLVDLCEELENPAYETLCLNQAQWLMDYLPRTREGAFQHVTSAIGDRQGVRLNESELWIDTIFMTVLFLNKMGHKYNRKDWISEANRQILLHIKYLYEKKTGLFYHGWSFNENSNFGEVFWCRGNSWFTFGIIDFLEISRSLNAGVKKYILDTFKTQVNTLVKLQAPSGLWHTVLNDSTSYEEVSGSAAIATGILKAIKLGLLDDSYQIYADQAIEAICNNIDTDGTVLNVSAGTGMGYNAEHYKNVIIAPMAYGQSLALTALCEALV